MVSDYRFSEPETTPGRLVVTSSASGKGPGSHDNSGWGIAIVFFVLCVMFFGFSMVLLVEVDDLKHSTKVCYCEVPEDKFIYRAYYLNQTVEVPVNLHTTQALIAANNMVVR